MYAYVEDNETVYSSDALTLTITNENLFEIRHEQGSNDYLFYVNGVLVATINRDFSSPLDDVNFLMRIQNSTGSSRVLYVSDVEYDIGI